nr:hypothetical protein [uncultured Draconibacterium sp.]
MASLDFNKQLGKVNFNFLAEAFYPQLNDAFVNDYGDPDENGVVIYTQTNAKKGAKVQGGNIELNIAPSNKFSLKSGFTI